MARFLKQKQYKRGLPPGSLIYVPSGDEHQVKINFITYSPDHYEEKVVATLDECVDKAMIKETISWINIEGLSDAKLIEDIGKKFGVHRLWLEDVLNTDHRPKSDEMSDLVFVILKTVEDFNENETVSFEQVSIFLGDGFVLSFQELPGDVFKSVKSRIRKAQGKIRTSRADYLFYALIDSIVDDYLDTIEKIGQKIEGIENHIATKLDPDTPRYIMKLKQEILYLSKASAPIRDALSQICRSTAKEIQKDTKEFFKDALEHSIQVNDTIESYRQMLGSLNEFYSSRVNLRMNEVMKVLTVFSAIFIPLTFIVGVYGMNFRHMPELELDNGYYYVWAVMLAVVFGMVAFIRHRKWF